MANLLLPSLSEAIAHHRRGDLQPAEQTYRTFLVQHPSDPEALHLLGVLMLQRGQSRQAVELIERAVADKPTAAVFHGNLAQAYQACGDLPRAAASCREALRLNPEALDVALNLGSVLVQLNQPAEAVAVYQYVLHRRPDHALGHNNCGNAFRLLGQTEQALVHFRRAVELDPQLGVAQSNLGQMLLDCERPQDALPHCQEAVRLQPKSTAAHNNLGNAYRKLGQFDRAFLCYAEALRLAPNLAAVHDNIGSTFLAQGKYDEAIVCFQTALRLAPDTVVFHLHLGEALTGRRDYAEAETHLRAAAAKEPNNSRIRFSLACCYSDRGRLDEAQREYRVLLAAQPNHPLVNQHLGEMLIELNQVEEALSCFRAALRGNPRFAPALAQLAQNLRGKLPDEEREALLRLSADPQLAEPERVSLMYAVAQIHDAATQYDHAAECLQRANAIEFDLRKKIGQDYNITAHVRFVDRLLQVFTPAFFERVRGFGVDSERPVFITGIPRSGTTLLEQILASHSRVFGAGELFFAREDFEQLGGGGDGLAETRAFDVLETIDAETVRALAQRHLQRLESLDSASARIIDKMPDNYLYIGFMSALFPRARFLHCRRDPRDVAVSCWMTQFRSVPWANDFEHMASRFEQHQRVMEHWRRVLPVPLLEVDYEEMVEDVEATARRVIAFCGLEWEPACLEFHRTRRPVRTASAAQVRQPIYRRSLARWRNYEKALQPLFSRLQTLSANGDALAPRAPLRV